MSYRLAADIGGTFTDVVLVDDSTGDYRTTKVLTTPEALAQGVIEGFDQLIDGTFKGVDYLIHGTTSGLNAVLERKGAPCALITTQGFRDVYEIGRGNRPDMYNNHFRKIAPLLLRKDIFEVKERLDAEGKVLETLDTRSLEALLPKVVDNYDVLAICFLNSYVNPSHEEQAAQWLKEHVPMSINVVCSYEIAPEWREYERVSTTVLSAYVTPKLRAHLALLRREMDEREYEGNIFIMQSNGGVIREDIATKKAVLTLMSGPVGATIGAQTLGNPNLINIDMGGTSFDVSIIKNGEVETTTESTVAGFPALVPSINIVSVGAGGGSIAWEEAGGMRVGPRSAGAVPGPICYGNGGTQPTVTDANLVLGRIPPDHFLDGRMELDLQGATQAFIDYGEKFGLDAQTAAEGVLAIANHKMADAIREITVRRGIDPRDFSLFAVGGAGPMHAVSIAEELSIDTVLVPYLPGVFSAWGMLQANIRHDQVRTLMMPLAQLDIASLRHVYEALSQDLETLIDQDGVEGRRFFKRALDIRYVGQEYTVNIPLSTSESEDKEAIYNNFIAAYLQLYGHSVNGEIEIVNVRVSAEIEIAYEAQESDSPRSADPDTIPTPLAIKTQRAVFNQQEYDVPLYERRDLQAGTILAGPAIIVELTSTTVLPPSWALHVDSRKNMVLSHNTSTGVVAVHG